MARGEVAEVVLLQEGRGVVLREGVHLEARGRGPCSWSIDIVGVSLGVKTTVVCNNCKGGRLHHSSECPGRWAKSGGCILPGFLADGTRDPAQWARGKEPIRATVQAWVTLLKDHSKWNSAAPVRYGVQGAPALADFERRVPLAPAKP